MPTTSNFGWTTPADTDLVKDGAAAIRTLGNGIDTSFLDLKGGTTGQNLRKATNTDLDFTWAGDATNTVIDAEGDLLVGDSADTLQRLAIGTTGQVLTVDTTVDGKIKWAAAAAASFVGVEVSKTAGQTVNNTTYTAITFDSEGWDTDAFHDNSTNNTRLTIPTGKGGYYLISGYITWNAFSGDSGLEVRKNGTTAIGYPYWWSTPTGNNNPSYSVSFIVNLVAGDYIEFRVYQDTGTAKTINAGTKVQLTKVG